MNCTFASVKNCA